MTRLAIARVRTILSVKKASRVREVCAINHLELEKKEKKTSGGVQVDVANERREVCEHQGERGDNQPIFSKVRSRDRKLLRPHDSSPASLTLMIVAHGVVHFCSSPVGALPNQVSRRRPQPRVAVSNGCHWP